MSTPTSSNPMRSDDAPVWLVSLDSSASSPQRAYLLVCSHGSENDVRELARCYLGRNWNTSTADPTTMVGPVGTISKANFDGDRWAFRSRIDAESAAVAAMAAAAVTPTSARRRRPRP